MRYVLKSIHSWEPLMQRLHQALGHRPPMAVWRERRSARLEPVDMWTQLAR